MTTTTVRDRSTVEAGSNTVVVDTDGIIPRSIEHLFETIEHRRATAAKLHGERVDFVVHTSFYEIYNEMVFDLLTSDVGSTAAARVRGWRSNGSMCCTCLSAARVGVSLVRSLCGAG